MIMVDMDDSCVQDTEACILQAQEALSCNAQYWNTVQGETTGKQVHPGLDNQHGCG